MDGADTQSNGFLLVDGDFLRVKSHNDVQLKRVQRNVAKDSDQKGFDAVGGQTMGQNSNPLFCQNALLLGWYIQIIKKCAREVKDGCPATDQMPKYLSKNA